MVRGSVATDVIEMCLARNVLVLEKVKFPVLQSVAKEFGVTMVTYLTDILEVIK